MNLTRWIRVFLASGYLLTATQAPALALDRFTAASKTVVSLDFPCADHGCCCKTAEQCRLRCCCHLSRVQQAAEKNQARTDMQRPGTVRMTYLDALDCAGQPASGGVVAAQRLDPHLPFPKALFRLAAIPNAAVDESSAFPVLILAKPHDKVPI